MSSTYTPSLTLTQIGNGEQSGTWGTTTNTNWQLIEDSVAGVATVSVSGTTGATLSVANGATDQSRKAVIIVNGATSGTNAIVAPLQPKVYIISNQTTGGFSITIGASTGSIVTIPNGVTTLVYCDGTNFSSGITGFTGGNLSISGTITATGTVTGATFATSGGVPQLAGGATGQIPYQTGANATGYTPAPTTGSYLTWNGSAYAWSTGSVTTASNLAGGSANSVPYQTSAGNTSFLTPTGGTPLTLQYNGSTLNWAAAGAVSSFSASGTGLTPSTPTTGAITLGGTLNIANGGIGATSFASAGLLTTSTGGQLSGTNVWSGSGNTFNNGINFPGVGTSLGNGALNFSQYTSIFYTSNQMQFAVNTSVFNDVLILDPSYIYANKSLLPYSDNSVACGGAANRWTQIYAVSNVINTSDENEKTEISSLDETEKRVATRIKGLVKKYKWKDSVAEKGADSARIHVGFIAQDIRDAFVAEGLDPTRYGMFCSDDIPAEEAVYYPDGTLKKAAVIACTRLGVRYDQVIAFVISAL